jgi:hypothetical protein
MVRSRALGSPKLTPKARACLFGSFCFSLMDTRGCLFQALFFFVESVFDGRLGMSRLMVEDTQAALTDFFGTGEEDEGEEDEKEKTLTDPLYPTTHTSLIM